MAKNNEKKLSKRAKLNFMNYHGGGRRRGSQKEHGNVKASRRAELKSNTMSSGIGKTPEKHK